MRKRIVVLGCLGGLYLGSAGFGSAQPAEAPVVAVNPAGSSIVTLSCADCPAPGNDNQGSGYTVPDLASGTARVELKTIGGQMKMVRTEAWSGGSPVVFVGKASQEDIRAAAAAASPQNPTADAAPVTGDRKRDIAAIDMTATTASLTGVAVHAAKSPPVELLPQFNADSLELRLK